MAVTVQVYNQTAPLFAQGAVNVAGTFTQPETADSLGVRLYTDATPPFNAADVSMSALTGTYTELSHPAYTSGTGVTLTTVAVVQTANDAYLDADDLTIAAGGTALTARYAILFRRSKTGDAINRPLIHIDFGQSETAAANTDFKIVWSASGIFSFIV